MMKNNMRCPVAAEIYQQKTLYQVHLRKLEKIRQERKNHLAYDSTRIAKQQELKQSKSRSFAHKYNEQHQEISQSNIKFLKKLEKVRPFTQHTSFSGVLRNEKQPQALTPYRRKQQIQTLKENTQMCNRIRSVSSSLRKDKMLQEYSKSQQIKSRISRYSIQNNRISLKSESFVSSIDKPLTSHYKYQDIINNSVQNRLKAAREHRYRINSDFRLSQNKKVNIQKASLNKTSREDIKDEEGLFATEPIRVGGKKKIFI